MQKQNESNFVACFKPNTVEVREPRKASQSVPMETYLWESKQTLMHPSVIGSTEDSTFTSIIHLSENYWEHSLELVT